MFSRIESTGSNILGSMKDKFKSRGLNKEENKEETVNFMDGKKLTPQNYFEQLNNLVMSQISDKDTNKDSMLSFEEYGADERSGFDMIDYDGTGFLEYRDLITSYWIADQLGTKNTDNYLEDGEFTNLEYMHAAQIMGAGKNGAKPDATNEEKIAKKFVDDLYSYFE